MLKTEDVVAEYKKHRNTREAGKALGVTHSAVIYHLEKAGVDRQRSALPGGRVAKLYREGYSMNEIGDAFDVSDTAIHDCLIREGVETRSSGRRQWLDLPVDQIVEDWRNGASATELAEEYDCTKTTIRKRIADNA